MQLTFKIIGGDGREYGPAQLEELRGWVREGRVAAATQVWRSDSDRWQPAAAITEIAAELARLPASMTARPAAEWVPVGFWIRFVAYWIDQVLLSVVLTLVARPPDAPLGTSPTSGELAEFIRSFGLYFAISLVLSGVYYIVMTAHFGATVGKMIFRARVVKIDGTRVGYGASAIRFLGSIVSWLILGIGYLFVAFREDKRALHDLMAGTCVAYREE